MDRRYLLQYVVIFEDGHIINLTFDKKNNFIEYGGHRFFKKLDPEGGMDVLVKRSPTHINLKYEVNKLYYDDCNEMIFNNLYWSYNKKYIKVIDIENKETIDNVVRFMHKLFERNIYLPYDDSDRLKEIFKFCDRKRKLNKLLKR